MFRAAVGVVLIAYCSTMLFARRLPNLRWGGRVADGAVGMVGGAMVVFGGLTGPAPTLWCTLRGWHKDEQRSVFQVFDLPSIRRR